MDHLYEKESRKKKKRGKMMYIEQKEKILIKGHMARSNNFVRIEIIGSVTFLWCWGISQEDTKSGSKR